MSVKIIWKTGDQFRVIEIITAGEGGQKTEVKVLHYGVVIDSALCFILENEGGRLDSSYPKEIPETAEKLIPYAHPDKERGISERLGTFPGYPYDEGLRLLSGALSELALAGKLK